MVFFCLFVCLYSERPFSRICPEAAELIFRIKKSNEDQKNKNDLVICFISTQMEKLTYLYGGEL